MGFIDQLLQAINEQQAASAFGPDWRLKERKARIEERAAESDFALRRAQTLKATRGWDAKLRAAQQLYPDLGPEDALAKSESEDIDLGRQTKRAIIGLHEAQAVKAKTPPAKRYQAVTSGKRLMSFDPEAGAFAGDLGPAREPIRISTGGEGGFAANPFPVTDAQGNTRLAVRIKGGGLQFVDKIGDEPVGAGPTAEQRNQERYDIMIPEQIRSLRSALTRMKASTSGTFGGLAAFDPTSQAFRDTKLYTRLVEAMGATASRGMGDTRISDIDRKLYSGLYGVANQLAATEPGSKLAEDLLNQAEALMTAQSAARKRARIPVSAQMTPAATAPQPDDEGGADLPDVLTDEEMRLLLAEEEQP